jgi:hypothetical protein
MRLIYEAFLRSTIRPRPRVLREPGIGEIHAGTPREAKKRIRMENAAHDDHRMCPHDIDGRGTPKIPQMVSADNYIVASTPHMVPPSPRIQLRRRYPDRRLPNPYDNKCDSEENYS